MTMPARRWLTPTEAAEALRLSPKTVYAMIGRQEIPFVRVGRRTVRVDGKALEEDFARQEADRKNRMRGGRWPPTRKVKNEFNRTRA